MAKKRRGEKTEAVRDYLNAHPGAVPTEIVAAMAKQKIKLTRSHAANIKTKLNKASPAKKAAKPAAVAAPPALAAVAKPANGGTFTLEQIEKVAHTIKTLGGYPRMTEVLGVIKEAGGVKKFKDLAEAMSCPETDAMPF